MPGEVNLLKGHVTKFGLSADLKLQNTSSIYTKPNSNTTTTTETFTTTIITTDITKAINQTYLHLAYIQYKMKPIIDAT